MAPSFALAYLVQLQAGDAPAPKWEDAFETKHKFKRAQDSKDLKAMAHLPVHLQPIVEFAHITRKT